MVSLPDDAGGDGEIFGERKHDELNARVPVAEPQAE